MDLNYCIILVFGFFAGVLSVSVKHDGWRPEHRGWSTWHDHSRCSASCGGGVRTRARKCHGGRDSDDYRHCGGAAYRTESCNTHPCPDSKEHVHLSSWTTWFRHSKCSVSCGGGVQIRTRSCHGDRDSDHHHRCSGSTVSTQPCNTHPCPDTLSGRWSTWHDSSHCSVSCGGGLRTRTRSCHHHHRDHKPKGGHHDHYDYPCQGPTTRTEACNTQPCPVNGGWSRWHTQSKCSVSCGGGVKVQVRYCDNPPPRSGGQQCSGVSTQSVPCKTRLCPVNGGWSRWKVQSKCSVSCGGGVRVRARTCTNPPPGRGGQQCIGISTRSETCNTKPCPVDGGWSRWQHTSCSVTCGGGVKSYTRTCTHPSPSPGGHKCPGPSTRSEVCNTQPCPVDGGWSSWQNPSQCSVTCDGGLRTRTRTCNHPTPANGGNQCQGGSLLREHCNTSPCPVPTTTTTTTTTTMTPPTTTTTPPTTTTTPPTTTTTPPTTTTTPPTTTTTPPTTTTTPTKPPTTTTMSTPSTTKKKFFTIRAVLN
ncbi:coadhesin-like isoform X2 [Crassostrea angulata]|uniref:coadhesin-like isoform X2 n=1 Tax=Magallana angulata TaxID=2784310 RepID=UPI0022B14BA5|nr:coadhesin-like isoform X2 [Crassostrea angulata]